MKQNLQCFFYTSMFYSRLLTKLMTHGKKEYIENIVFKVFLQIARTSKIPVFFIFFEIVEKQRIILHFRKIIKKKQIEYLPYTLTFVQQYWFSVALIVKSIKSIEKKTSIFDKIITCLSMYYSYNNRLFLYGIKEKKRLYQLAMDNRFLIHYRW